MNESRLVPIVIFGGAEERVNVLPRRAGRDIAPRGQHEVGVLSAVAQQRGSDVVHEGYGGHEHDERRCDLHLLLRAAVGIADHIVIARRHTHMPAPRDVGEIFHELVGKGTDIAAALAVEEALHLFPAVDVIVAVRLEERVIALGTEVNVEVEVETRVDRVLRVLPRQERR